MPTTPNTSELDADSTLLITLAGVAELAGVQRAVASTWRARFRAGAQPFPAAVARRGSSDLFDAAAIADWLVETGHGNNPDARVDAAASAAPADLDFADPDHVAELEALVALRALTSTELAAADLVDLARGTDPSDTHLRSEIERHAQRANGWSSYADALVDASFTPAAALDRVAARARQSAAADASTGPLLRPVVDLVSDVVVALSGRSGIRLGDGVSARLLKGIVERAGDDVDVVWPSGASGRRLRRRAVAAGLPAVDASASGTTTVTRIPTEAGQSVYDMIAEVDSIVLDLTDADSMVVLGPARVLTDAVSDRAERVRADLLRTGRVRAIVRLREGLVASATREALALWVVGPSLEAPIAERETAVADLTDVTLTAPVIADLVSDIAATVDGARPGAHAYRFARVVRTSSLLARASGLTRDAAPRRRPDTDPRTLPALLDQAAARLGADGPAIHTSPHERPATRPQTTLFADAVANRQVRVISGVRIAPDEVGAEGFALIGPAELADPALIGDSRIERLAFAAVHPNAQLTRPGDVVFCTAPAPHAWVDDEGSHVVAYPARIARVSRSDPGGLIPELVAADIRKSISNAWRRWSLRTVEPAQRGPLREALRAAASTRRDLERRIADLDRYTDLLADGVSARAVTVIPDAGASEK